MFCCFTISLTNYLFLVPTGYCAILNATHYEFDVNVYSPIGTVVFEILILFENPEDVLIVFVDFWGTIGEFRPYSINEMGQYSTFCDNFTDGIITNVTLRQELDPGDENDIYQFEIYFLALGVDYLYFIDHLVNVILHEIG